MAAAQVLRHVTPALEATAEVSNPVAHNVESRLAIHDTSRLEWAVSVPLPRTGEAEYSIEVDLEVPAHVITPHSPWNQLQEFARLDGPDDTTPSVATVDGMRRFAVGVAAKLARAHEGFGRHARLVVSPFTTEDPAHHLAALESWIATAEQTIADARVRLSAAPHSLREPPQLDLAREGRLADEYLSLRLLELLAGSEQALASVVDHIAHPKVADVGGAVGEALAREMEYRATADYPEADIDSPHGLERYLDRASQLKKHFQEVLFLESERFAVTERLHHWVAGAVAIIASTWAFVGQLYLTRGSSSARLGSSIIMVCVMAGVIYAVKDRIKEIGRAWFAANVHRFYAQRIARYRAPRKTCPDRDIVVRARESFVSEDQARPDPLNPHSGATVPVTNLQYRHLGTLEASKTLNAAGISRVKHVFRYDLSPLFARLDDATKPVPIFDAQARRVRFTQAPRCYRVPVKLVVRRGNEIASQQSGALILHKRGLERIELV